MAVDISDRYKRKRQVPHHGDLHAVITLGKLIEKRTTRWRDAMRGANRLRKRERGPVRRRAPAERGVPKPVLKRSPGRR